jgi:ATP-dependent Clp protease, protease subunit
MAGDEIQIARAGFMMIHNAWVAVVGNRNELIEVAETLEPFDKAMADIYATRTGEDIEKIQSMMDAETFIGGSECVEFGFADSLLPSDEVEHNARAELHALRRLDVALAKAGMPRAERRKLLQEVGTPGAADDHTPSAVNITTTITTGELVSLSTDMRGLLK